MPQAFKVSVTMKSYLLYMYLSEIGYDSDLAKVQTLLFGC